MFYFFLLFFPAYAYHVRGKKVDGSFFCIFPFRSELAEIDRLRAKRSLCIALIIAFIIIYDTCIYKRVIHEDSSDREMRRKIHK